MRKEFKYVDVAFVIDTTGSMGAFINEAKKRLSTTLKELSSKNDIDLNVGLVQYRDHPPQENTFVTQIVQMTPRMEHMQKEIDKLSPHGGGDAPEAVYQGVFDACESLHWREHSARFILLVGDSPPHAFPMWYATVMPGKTDALGKRGHGDGFPKGCPSNLDVNSVTAAAEKRGITIHAICMGDFAYTKLSFGAIASGTGGRSSTSNSAGEVVDKMLAMMTDEFKEIKFDKTVYDNVSQTRRFDSQELAEALGSTRQKVASSLARLGRRGFLDNLN